MNNTNNRKITDETIFGFYLAPFLSSIAIMLIISGESNWGPYNVSMRGLQVRILGVFLLIFSLIPVYNILYSIVIKQNNLMNVLLKSAFFYVWINMIVMLLIFKLFKWMIVAYIISYIICMKLQIKFIKKYIK